MTTSDRKAGDEFSPRRGAVRVHHIRAGFSLIELIIVIGIIGLLIAIIMPTVGRARRQARTVNCLSNVRQINTAFAGYRVANDGRGFVYRTDQMLWMQELKLKFAAIDQVRLCPEATDPGPGGTGSSTTSWTWGGTYVGSYTMNGYLHYPVAPGSWSYYDSNPGTFVDALDSRVRSDETPAFCDGVWPDAWPTPADTVPPDPRNPAVVGGYTQNMSRVCVDRHNGGTNVAFLDGSTRYIRLPELWQIRWNLKWVSRDVTMP